MNNILFSRPHECCSIIIISLSITQHRIRFHAETKRVEGHGKYRLWLWVEERKLWTYHKCTFLAFSRKKIDNKSSLEIVFFFFFDLRKMSVVPYRVNRHLSPPARMKSRKFHSVIFAPSISLHSLGKFPFKSLNHWPPISFNYNPNIISSKQFIYWFDASEEILQDTEFYFNENCFVNNF
jgi:hypothetical protein